MDTWQQVTDAVAARAPLQRRGGQWLGVLWQAPGAGEMLPVRVERGAASGVDWLLVLVDVCSAAHLPLAEALARNLALPVGSYALERDRITLRAALPLAGAASELAGVIDTLVAEAVRRRAAIRAARATSAALLFGE
jgi:hypothetical protein